MQFLTDITGIELRNSWFLLASLSAIPVYFAARRSGGRVEFSSLSVLPVHRRSWRVAFAWVPDVLLAFAALLLGIALAGPRAGDKESLVHSEGIAIAMVVDTSGSMRALDLSEDENHRVTRLDAVKSVFIDFVLGHSANSDQKLPGRPDDAIGVVSFAGYADTRCPLTLDHQMVARIARTLEITRDRAEDGTAIGDGLGLAVERLRQSKATSKVAILLTDGVNNAGNIAPAEAAELARQYGIKVYTIGAGSNGLALVEVPDPRTGRPGLRQVRVEIDEETLKQIAQKTGGRYFRATDADSLRAIYGEIDALERSELQENRFLEYREFYTYALALALLLAFLAWLARATLWRKLP